MSIEKSTPDSIFTAYAFLAGATLTALFFLIQTNPKNEYVLTTLGVSSILFIMATIARLNIATGRFRKNTPFSRGVGWVALAGLVLLLPSLIIIILTVSLLSGILALVALITSFIILDRLARKES